MHCRLLQCPVLYSLNTADFSKVSWTLLGASLRLGEQDTIRRNKALEVGRREVSQQLHWLCPHSLNFMVGPDDKKTRKALGVGERKIVWDCTMTSVSGITNIAKEVN